MRIKKRNNFFIVSTIIVFIVLIILCPFLLNYKRIFQIGFYYSEENNFINFPSGRGIIYSKLNLDYEAYDRFEYNLQVSAKKEGNIYFNGFLSIEGEVLVNNHFTRKINTTWTIPINMILINSKIYLYKNDIVTFNLNITAQFTEQSQIHNETVIVSLSSLIKYNDSDIGNIEILFIWVYVLYFSSYGILPYILFLIFRPVFGIKDRDLDVKRSKKFYDFLSKRSASEKE